MIYSRPPAPLLHTRLSGVKGETKVLDVGCGTGWWPMLLAEDHPNYEIIGIDIAGHQPTGLVRYPNVDFKSPVDFTGDDWWVTPGSFQVVRGSQLCGSIPDYNCFYRNVLR